MKDYIELGNRISWEDNSLVIKFLSSNKDLDVLHDNGSYFIRSIENNCHDIVITLLDYFKNNQLSKCAVDSYKYLSLNKKMYEVIRIATEDVEISEEMQVVLSPYINLDDEVDSKEHDFSKNEILLNKTLKKVHSTIDLSVIQEEKENSINTKNTVNDIEQKIDDFSSCNVLFKARAYNKEFKGLVQQLLTLKGVNQVSYFLETLKFKLELDRIPKKATLNIWNNEDKESRACSDTEDYNYIQSYYANSTEQSTPEKHNIYTEKKQTDNILNDLIDIQQESHEVLLSGENHDNQDNQSFQQDNIDQ